MTDSDKKNELDNYGVWVKKPPRDITPETDSQKSEAEDSFDIAADLPDFSSLDDIPEAPHQADSGNDFMPSGKEDTSLTTEELSNITGSLDIQPENSAKPEDEPLDIDFSLDDIPEEKSEKEEAPAENTESAQFADIPSDSSIKEEPLPDMPEIDAAEEAMPAAEEKTEKAPEAETTAADSIPDTFDQETAAFTEPEPADKPVLPVDEKPAHDDDIAKRSNELLESIRNELSSLKDEITSLKNDFADLKNKASVTVPSSGKTKEDTGFFNNTGDDDTIALSGDELDNILNNADFTKEEEEPPIPENAEDTLSKPVQEDTTPAQPETKEPVDQDNFYEDEPSSDNGLNIDFNADNLDEPQLDNIDLDTAVSPSKTAPLPNEISVPKQDDILVESSSTDLMDSGDETNNIENQPAAKPEEEFAEPDTIDDLYPKEPSIEETLSDDKIDYLSSDEKIAEAESLDDFEEPKVSEAEPAATAEESAAAAQEPQTVEEPLPDMEILKEPAPEAEQAQPVEENIPEIEPLEESVPEAEEAQPAEPAEDAVPDTTVLEEPAAEAEPVEPAVEDITEIPAASPEETATDADIPEAPAESVETTVSADFSEPAVSAETDAPAAAVSSAEEPSAEPAVPVTDFAEPAEIPETPVSSEPAEPQPENAETVQVPSDLTKDIKSVLSYMDQLLENLPDDKISEFAQSEQFVTYKKLFTELGLA